MRNASKAAPTPVPDRVIISAISLRARKYRPIIMLAAFTVTPDPASGKCNQQLFKVCGS